MSRISIIGNGNLAQNLVNTIKLNAHEIVEMYSKDFNSLSSFCKLNNIKVLNNLEALETNIDFLIIAVSDNVIELVLKQIPLGNYIVLHTAGSISIDVFNKRDIPNYAVMYPLYSFNKDRLEDFIKIPLMLESSNIEVKDKLYKFAKSLSDIVTEVSSKERQVYHLAGVLSNNFTNHLLSLTQEFVEKNNLEFNLLKPIIEETVINIIKSDNIENLQTGPAKRASYNIINRHIELLENDDILPIYKELTNSILQKNNKQTI